MTFTATMIQFLKPDGRKHIEHIELPMKVSCLYGDMLGHSCRIEVEVLVPGDISLTIANSEEDLDIELIPNQERFNHLPRQTKLITDRVVKLLKRESWKNSPCPSSKTI